MSDVGRRRERGRGHRKGKERSYLFVQPVKGGKVVHTNRESTRDVQHLYLAGDGIDRFSKEWTYEAKKTVVLSTFAGLEPEALRTSPRFFSACSCTPHTTSPNVSVPCYICKGRREREGGVAAHSLLLNLVPNDGHRLWVERDSSGGVDHAVVFDGLGVRADGGGST
jgi:hypothetical protein